MLQTTDILGEVKWTVTEFVSFAVVMEAESNNCWHAYSQLQLYLMYILSLLPYTANSKDLVSEMEYIQRALNQITKDDAAAESSKNLNL